MKIIVLTDDTYGDENILAEHGLCMYIESAGNRILADTGATGIFLDNAERLSADISSVDTVFLSHGHYDHTGGLARFLSVNSKARILFQPGATDDFYSIRDDGPHYIGSDKNLFESRHLMPTEGSYAINESISVFTGISGRRGFSSSNLRLKRMQNGIRVQDDFSHEQYLVVEEGGRTYLFSGCAHNGILNILDRFRELYGKNPDYVFSGFHFMKSSAYTAEEEKNITDTARELKETGITFFTCHCTSFPAYWLMKPIMGENLHILCSGFIVNL